MYITEKAIAGVEFRHLSFEVEVRNNSQVLTNAMIGARSVKVEMTGDSNGSRYTPAYCRLYD